MTSYRVILSLLVGLMSSNTFAFQWQDLWETRDHRAQTMMQAKQYKQAQQTFEQPDWRATAAFRANNYQEAMTLYRQSNTSDAYYNAGNALAYLGRYAEAIRAYDKAFALNKTNHDAMHNRQVVEKLLKKQKQQSNNQNQPNPEQQKQDQNDQNSASKSSNQTETPKDNPQQNESPNKESDQPDQQKQPESHATPNDRDETPDKSTQSEVDRDQQQANDQLLRLIPDDPGGLLREKFLRDYLRKRGELS